MEEKLQRQIIKNICGDKQALMDECICNACKYAGVERGTKKDAITIMYELLDTISLNDRSLLWEWARVGGEMGPEALEIIETLRGKVAREFAKDKSGGEINILYIIKE